MITLPNNHTNEPNEPTISLPVGEHEVALRAVKLVTLKSGEDKLLVEYANETGEFLDWLGFKTAAQGARTYAYICRLHELAGLEVPKGGRFNEESLVGTRVTISLVNNERGYLTLADFPSSTAGGDIPF